MYININDLNENKEGLQLAVKYYRYCLNGDLSVNRDFSLGYILAKAFDSYSEELKNLSTSNQLTLKEAKDLLKGFIYINDEIKSKQFKPTHVVTIKAFKSYVALIKEIGKYNFTVRYCDSYGAYQNKANQNMLIDLLFFKPIVIETITNIETALDSGKMPPYQSVQVLNKLLNMSSLLNEIRKDLEDFEDEYHTYWNMVTGRDCSYDRKKYPINKTKSNLGRVKNAWRLKKNEACRAVMDFYSEMAKINQELRQLEPNKYQDLDRLYQYGFNEIINSPYYYSYLTREEIEEKTKENKAKKLEMKKHS